MASGLKSVGPCSRWALQLLEVLGALGNEGRVGQAFAQDDVQHRVEQGHVGAGR
jgi:hypothetical protein